MCKQDPQCIWFTYFSSSRMCIQYTNCATIDETCTECISGEFSCVAEGSVPQGKLSFLFSNCLTYYSRLLKSYFFLKDSQSLLLQTARMQMPFWTPLKSLTYLRTPKCAMICPFSRSRVFTKWVVFITRLAL